MVVGRQREQGARAPREVHGSRAPTAVPAQPAVAPAARPRGPDPLAGVLARAVQRRATAALLQRVRVESRDLRELDVAESEDALPRNAYGELAGGKSLTIGDDQWSMFLHANGYSPAKQDLTSLTGIFRPGKFGPEYRITMKESRRARGFFAVSDRSRPYPEAPPFRESAFAESLMIQRISDLIAAPAGRARRYAVSEGAAMGLTADEWESRYL